MASWLAALLCVTVCAPLKAQPGSLPPQGKVERIKLHGKSLENNLAGDSAVRHVSVYLPPSYAAEANRRYPVIYMLHGFTDSDAKWFTEKHWINLPTVLNRAFAAPGAKEAIVVMPNAFTRYQGSMYSTSATVGDWETFVAKELVAFIDSRYRTLAGSESRGLAGHSMGGYGTLRIGMKHPEVFSALYALSPCCLGPNLEMEKRQDIFERAGAIRSPEEIAGANFLTKAMLASGAAWSANPAKPPLYLDLPWENGQYHPEVAARWIANAPLITVHQHIGNLRKLSGLAFDSGDKDASIAATSKDLHGILDQHKIQHQFEIYEGDHVNRIAERIETQVIPFFSRRLAGGK